MKGNWRGGILALLLLWMPSAASGQGREDRAKRIRDASTISYTGRYEVACSKRVVEQALAHPLVMGALWASYGYAPAYRVSERNEPGAVHVLDPTGIVGDLWPVRAEEGGMTYLAEGKLDHWAVPALNEGTAVFVVGVAEAGPGVTRVAVDVFLRPESRIAGAVMWALAPMVRAHIKNRVSLNFQDAARILKEIEAQPGAVGARLQGGLRQAFEDAFGTGTGR